MTEFGIRDHYTRRVGELKYTTVSYFVMPTMNKTGYHHEEDHPAGFRAAHPGYEAMWWRVPVDDLHTLHVTVAFSPLIHGKPAPALPADRQEEGISETPPGVFRWDESIGAIARARTKGFLPLRKCNGRSIQVRIKWFCLQEPSGKHAYG